MSVNTRSVITNNRFTLLMSTRYYYGVTMTTAVFPVSNLRTRRDPIM